jgi:hypothetical protein
MYVEFMRVQLRKIAAGLGITYEQLTGDLTGVNYSSIRAGMLEFRRRAEQFQHQVMVFQFCRPVWTMWIRLAVVAGAISAPRYLQERRKYETPKWIAPGWPWVDPLKDITAKIQEIQAGLTSRSAAVAETGEDIETIDKEQAADNARADKLKLRYTSDGRNADGADLQETVAGASEKDQDDKSPLREPRTKTAAKVISIESATAAVPSAVENQWVELKEAVGSLLNRSGQNEERMLSAIEKIANQAPPVVNVDVAPPAVTVESGPITLNMPARPGKFTIQRDEATGTMTGVEATE